MSREIPILFRDDLVRAILAGKKTLSRRVGASWAKAKAGDRLWVRECHAIRPLDYWDDYWRNAGDRGRPSCMQAEEVYYRATPRVGLRRWVGPTAPAPDAFQGQPHRMTYLHESSPLESGPAARVERWRPSIHMPRWACRLELEIVSVTPQQMVLGGGLGQMAVLLPDVDDDEARREGVGSRSEFLDLWRRIHADLPGDTTVYRVEFRRLP